MAKGFKHGAGGGTSLNFKVIGNPQPETAKDNTIWVDTDVKITGWNFNAAQPETAEEGMVWFTTSTSSTAPFNALKKNGIMVYPMSAKQYINGAWVNKTAKTYQGGKWVDWVVYVVPSNTFTWFSNNTVRGNVTKNSDNSVTVNCTSTNYYVMAFTNQTFDLTGFNKMIVTYTSTSGYTMAAIGVATSTSGTEAYNEFIAYAKVNKTSTPVTATINISNINRPVYFGATEFNGSITIKEIRLEV